MVCVSLSLSTILLSLLDKQVIRTCAVCVPSGGRKKCDLKSDTTAPTLESKRGILYDKI